MAIQIGFGNALTRGAWVMKRSTSAYTVKATAARDPMTIQRTMVLIVRTYTGRVSPWIRYSLIRLGLFAATFSILFFLGIVWWASALFATAMSFTVSYIFFHTLRNEVAEDLAKRVEKSRTTDDDSAIEDGALDSESDR
jgi:hypothetical protein